MNNNLQLINFDTINSIYTSINSTSFNCKFQMMYPLPNVKKIFLKSVELPIGFCNIRSAGGSSLNTFSINLNSVNYSIVLADTNYTSIVQLCTDITTAFNGGFTSGSHSILASGLTLTLTQSNSYISASITGTTNITNFSINQTQLSQYILGFVKGQSSTTINNSGAYSNTIISQNWYNLSIDNYISFYLANIPATSTSNNNSSYCSFKILTTTTNGNILFFEDNSTFRQSVLLSQYSQPITEIHIKIYDRFGNLLINNGFDWSFTLAFEFYDNQ